MGKGIDYGMGTTNIDKETGIRFGVISQNDVLQSWADSSEPDYGEPTCPECGSEIGVWAGEGDEPDTEEYLDAKHGCNDHACHYCKRWFDSSEVYGDEPNGFTLDDGEYQATCGSSGDIFILSSPYFTRAAFCSPCAPGACHLGEPCEEGERAYCFGHDWFDEGTAPYPVYSVETGALVPAPVKE